nr:zinc finger, CCHC-type [Tanacetum cinerariifolium]
MSLMNNREVSVNVHQRVDGYSFVTHRVSRRIPSEYSIRRSILSGLTHQSNPSEEMAEEDALHALQHECGVCADYPMLEDGENPTVEQGRGPSGTMITMSAEDASSKKFLKFTNYKMTDSRPVLEQYNELLGILGSHLRIDESLRAQENNKSKGNNVVGPSVVNMVEHNNSSRYNDHKGKRKNHDTRANPNKKPKVTCWKCGKPGHLKKDCKSGDVGNIANVSSTKGSEDGSSNPLKENVSSTKGSEDGSSNPLKGQNLRFSTGKFVSMLNVLHVPNIRKNLVSSSILNNYGYKQVIESNKYVLSKHGLFIGFGYLSNHMFRLNIVSDNIDPAFMSTSKLNDSILCHARLGHVHFKRMQDMSKDGLIPAIDMDTKKCKTMLTKITKKPFQNVKRKTKVLELIHKDLCDLHGTPLLGNKKYFVTFIDDVSRFCYVYLLHTKDEALDKFKVFKTEVELQQESLIKRFRTDEGGEYMDTLYFQSVGIIHETTAPYTPQKNAVRNLDPKLKTLGERGIECIFVGYAEHSKAFRFYVIKPNDSVDVNSIIESKDAIFDEHRLSFVSRPSQRSLVKGTNDSGGSMVSERVTDEIVQQSEYELRKSKRQKTLKDFGPEFQLYLIKGTRNEVSDQYSYCFNVEDDPKTFDETWVLTGLPPGCTPLGCKWIFKRKLKVDGTVEKFKARLVIQGFKQKSGINYFDTYSPVARISTIRLLIAMASIHNLIIHQIDVKTAFLNRDLKEELPKQWHQKFDEVVLSNGYLLNQADKCMYSKFNASGKGVIICLYVDDMLIFGTDQVQVDLTKEFFSSRLSMKDMEEADVILGIRIKHDSNGIAISQSHYIEKVLKKFNYSDCTPVSTPLDTCRPDIAFAVEKLSRYTSTPGIQHWQAIQRVLKYLKKTMDYRLVYSSYPSVLEGYTNASWISNTEDNSSTSGWVFLLGGGAISWASKKQTCITSSTMKSEFVALAAAGKEAEWLKNLLLEIPLWVKTMAPISIRCNSAATLAKAYSQMDLFIPVSEGEGTEITPREVSVNVHQRVDGYSFVTHRMKYPQRVNSSEDCFSIEPSAGMLLSGLADSLGH